MYGFIRRRVSGAALKASLFGTSILVLLPACAARTTGVAALPDREFVGHLLTMEESNWFRPCGSGPDGSLLWVTFTDASVGQIGEARSDGIALVGDTAFVRFRAALTDERLVGPGGPALLVRDIADIRPAAGEDCSARSSGPSAPRPPGGPGWLEGACDACGAN